MTTAETSMRPEIRIPKLPGVYRVAQAYLGVLSLCGVLAMWRVYDSFWSDSRITLGALWDAIPRMQLREIPELLMASVPVWMPLVLVILGLGIWVLRRPRRWALVATLAVAAMALLLIVGVDGALHRIEGNYYEHSTWVEVFWQNAYPVMAASIGVLAIIPGMYCYERFVR